MALTVTSLGLVIGFAILGQSGFAVNRDMARLTAITLSFALFVDFLFLPTLLIFLDRMKTMKTNATSTASLAVDRHHCGRRADAATCHTGPDLQ